MKSQYCGYVRAITTLTLISVLLLFVSTGLLAQSGTSPAVVMRTQPITVLNFYDGSGNLEYVCTTSYPATRTVFSVAASTLTSIVDSSNTSTLTIPSHGLAVNNQITIAGATDTDLNTSFVVQTVSDANTITITTSSVTDTTYNEAGLTVTTNAPRSSAAIWQITKYTYSGSSPIRKQNSRPNQICDNRAVSTGATKVAYE